VKIAVAAITITLAELADAHSGLAELFSRSANPDNLTLLACS